MKESIEDKIMEIKHDLYLGDCEEILKTLPDNSVDLIFTIMSIKVRNFLPGL